MSESETAGSPEWNLRIDRDKLAADNAKLYEFIDGLTDECIKLRRRLVAHVADSESLVKLMRSEREQDMEALKAALRLLGAAADALRGLLGGAQACPCLESILAEEIRKFNVDQWLRIIRDRKL